MRPEGSPQAESGRRRCPLLDPRPARARRHAGGGRPVSVSRACRSFTGPVGRWSLAALLRRAGVGGWIACARCRASCPSPRAWVADLQCSVVVTYHTDCWGY
uniref:Uncharacterized protein n=1 Tax=Arundo donax TaxID=35708 RepID=A0A0A9VGN9_ARUDO